MANITRRDPNETTRSTGDYRFDPFRVMDALLRWDPRGDGGGYLQGDFVPRFDIKETKDGFVIKADLPGVKDEDVNVSVTGSQLAISGKREEENREEGEHHYLVERSAGTFSRVFSLPDGADADSVTADMKNGVLTLKIPKRPEAQPRRINIGRAGSTNEGGGAGKAKA